MSAEEAYNAMQVAMIKANVREDDEATNARYLRVLNSSFSIEVEMYPYNTPIELILNAIKVERKIKNKGMQGSRPSANTNAWKGRSGGTRKFP